MLIKRRLFNVSILALFVTFFASFPVFAQPQKSQNHGRQERDQLSKQPACKPSSKGGNCGTGGGGAIVCEWQKPILTDLWEAYQTRHWAAVELDQLREKSIDQSLRYFAKRHSLLDGKYTVGENSIYREMNKMMRAVDSAIKSPGKIIRYKFQTKPGYAPANVSVEVDTAAVDPKDSGDIVALPTDGCHEERVAVSSADPGNELRNVPASFSIKIRRPDVFKELPPFDRVAMIVGHEFIHATTSGNVGNLSSVSKEMSNSNMVRQMNAWITLANDEKIQLFRKFGPLSRVNRSYTCSTIGPLGPWNNDTSNEETAFRLYIDDLNQQTIFELVYFKKQAVWLTTYAVLPLLNRATDIPSGLANPHNTGRTRNFQNINLVQVIPFIEKKLQAYDTGVALDYSVDGYGRAFLAIRNGSEVLLSKPIQCELQER